MLSGDMLIQIPSEIGRRLELRLKGSEYNSVQDYVISLIMDAIGDPLPYTKEDEKEIKERLSYLGYE